MFKSKEEFLESRRKKEEAEKIAGKKVDKLKNNSYFTNLIENRKKIKELTEKRYKLEAELNELRYTIEDTEQEEAYQVNLQDWLTPITLDSFKHDYNENCYQKVKYDFYQLYSPIVNISIELKERMDLKVWKFEITSRIKNVKSRYAEVVNSEVEKFKTKQEALNRVEELKQELYNKYAEDFAEINKSITLANEVKKAFKEVERDYLPNDLQRILKRRY